MKILSRITSTAFKFPSNSEIRTSTHNHRISAKSRQQVKVWDLVYPSTVVCCAAVSPATQPDDAQSHAGDTLLLTLRNHSDCRVSRVRLLTLSASVTVHWGLCSGSEGKQASVHPERDAWTTVELAVNKRVMVTCDIKQLQFGENVLLPWVRF